ALAGRGPPSRPVREVNYKRHRRRPKRQTKGWRTAVFWEQFQVCLKSTEPLGQQQFAVAQYVPSVANGCPVRHAAPQHGVVTKELRRHKLVTHIKPDHSTCIGSGPSSPL